VYTLIKKEQTLFIAILFWISVVVSIFLFSGFLQKLDILYFEYGRFLLCAEIALFYLAIHKLNLELKVIVLSGTLMTHMLGLLVVPCVLIIGVTSAWFPPIVPCFITASALILLTLAFYIIISAVDNLISYRQAKRLRYNNRIIKNPEG